MILKDFRNALKVKNFTKLALLLFICASASALASPFLSLFLAQKLNANASQIGIFITLNSISGIIISTILANLSDKLNDGKPLLAIAIISAVVGYIFYAIINNYYILLLLSIIFIGISSTITSQIFSYAKQNFCEVENSETTITFLRTFVSIAWVSSPLIGAFLDEKFSFSGLFIGTAVGYFCGFALLILFFKAKSKVKDNHLKDKPCEDKLYSNKFIIECFIVFTLLQLINTVLNTNVPLYITETLHYKNAYIGIISSFSAFVEIPFMVLLATLSLRVDIKKLINAGIICCFIFLILLLYVKNIYLIILIHILKSFFVSAYMGIGIAFFQGMIPNKYGTSTTLFTNTTRVGTMCGGIITGIFGKYYSGVFSVSIIICFLRFIIFNFAEEKRYKVLDEITKNI